MITFIYPPVVLDKTGLATEAQQQQQTALLTDIDAKVTSIDSKVSTSALQTAGNASLSSIDTKVATSALQTAGNSSLSSMDTKTPALGQALATASIPVVLTAAQITTLTPLTSVAINNFPGIQPVSGPLTDAQLRATPVPISGSVTTGGLTDTQLRASAVPVSLASTTVTNTVATTLASTTITGSVAVTGPLTDTQLRATPVPVSGTVSSTVTGTVTANAGANLNTSLLALDSTVAKDASLTTLNASVNTLLKPASTLAAVTAITNTVTIKADTAGNQANSLKVDGSATTQPISASALPLPTGASTSANQTTTEAAINTLLKPASTLAAVTVVGAVTQITNALPTGTNTIGFVKAAGKTSANLPARLDYTATPVTTAAFVQLVASTTTIASEIEIFDSSGQTLALAFGAAASEVIQINIFPGGNGKVSLSVPAGTRVSIKAVSATASVGEININFLN